MEWGVLFACYTGLPNFARTKVVTHWCMQTFNLSSHLKNKTLSPQLRPQGWRSRWCRESCWAVLILNRLTAVFAQPSVYTRVRVVAGQSLSREYPRAHLHMVGMLRFMSDINQPSLPTPFYAVLVSMSVFIGLSTVFHSINSPDNSSFPHSVFPVLPLPSWSFQLYIS